MKRYVLFLATTLLIMVATAQNGKIDSDGNYDKIVRVKFTKEMEHRLDRLSELLSIDKAKSSEGHVLTDIEAVDRLHFKHSVHKMKRIFRHAGKHERKHRDFGLHLWYQMEYRSSISAKDVALEFHDLDEVQVANPLPQIVREGTEEIGMDGVELKAASLSTAPNDPLFSEQWHLDNRGGNLRTAGADISMLDAWRIQTGSSRVVVAVMDRGVDHAHEDLNGNMWVNEDEIAGNGIDDDGNGYVDDVHGYDFEADTAHITPAYHGTHVAGIIAAETNNGIGVAGIAGGTGNDDGVRIMSCAAALVDNAGAANFAEAYTYAADNGAVISQNSWSYAGSRSYDQAILDGIDYFIAHAGGEAEAMVGGIVFFSAGNNSYSQHQFPSSHDQVIAVASTNPRDQKAWYSNFGDWIDIAAPGGEMRRAIDPNGVLSTIPNNRYDNDHGTSMACPVVSGVAALIVSQNYGIITPEQVKRVLLNHADNIDDENPSYIGLLGSGRVNAFAALSALNSTAPLLALEKSSDSGAQLEMKVAPNPAQNYLSVRVGGASGMLKIHDLAGKELKSQRIDGAISIIDISGLSQGVYFVSLIGEQGRVVRKILKE